MVCLAATVALAERAAAQTGRFLFVADTNLNQGIVQALEADGHSVDVVLNDFIPDGLGGGTNPTLAGDLSQYDGVFWSASDDGGGDLDHDDPAVFANLLAFVEAGGCVLVTGYDSIAATTDELLIDFIGAGSSEDDPGQPPVDPVANLETPVTVGVRDIRGLIPSGGSPASNDFDAALDLVEAVGILPGPDEGSWQWTIRSLGEGFIVWVSAGDLSGTSGAQIGQAWITDAGDGSGVYNAAVRNFAFNCALNERAVPAAAPLTSAALAALLAAAAWIAIARRAG
jgi:hypothetical protein